MTTKAKTEKEACRETPVPRPEPVERDEFDIWNEGRRELTVTHDDGSTETVTIRKVPTRHFEKLSTSMNDDAAQAFYFLANTPDKDTWWESLTQDSQLDILDKGWEINDPLFSKWWRIRSRRLKMMGIDLDQVMQDEIQAVLPPSAE